MRDNRFAAHVRILLPFAAEIASKFDPIETRIELAALLASEDFKWVGNSEAHYLADLERFRSLTSPISDEDILRMGAFLASDSSETMYIPDDKAGHAFEAFDQLVERACVHMIQGARSAKRTHDEWVADHYRFDQQEAVICVDDFEDALRAAEARGRAQAVLAQKHAVEQQAIEDRKAGKRGEAFWRIVLVTALHEPEEYSRDEAQSCIDRIFQEIKSIGAAEVRAALEKLLKALSGTGNAEDPDVLIAEREAQELLDKMNMEVKG